MSHLGLVPKTSLLIAACRAIESEKSEEVRLFHDPWARNLATNFGQNFIHLINEFPGTEMNELVTYVSTRTKFFDDTLLEALEKGIKQVVIPGVGVCARSRRLNLPSNVKVFEIDFPEIIEFRSNFYRDCGQLTHEIISIGADMRESNWLTALKNFDYDPDEKTIWIVEGLTMYLSKSDWSNFLNIVRSICPNGSIITGDMANNYEINNGFLVSFRRSIGAEHSIQMTGYDNPEELFLSHNFIPEIKIFDCSINNSDRISRVHELPLIPLQQKDSLPDDVPYFFLFKSIVDS